jgi:hypothetical protein
MDGLGGIALSDPWRKLLRTIMVSPRITVKTSDIYRIRFFYESRLKVK